MGMYSTFVGQDIRILDRKKLIDVEDIDGTYGMITSDGVSFHKWDNTKIEGYWYPNTKLILKALAGCIEGWVEFDYEGMYRYRIVFEDGKVYFQKGPEVDWDGVDMEELSDEL